MKFQVRDGFVVRLTRKIDLGEGKSQTQEIAVYEKQFIDLDVDEANDHAHKLDPAPRDKEAAAFLEAKVLPPQVAAAGPLDQSQLALIQAVAQATAVAVAAALQSPAQASSEAAAGG